VKIILEKTITIIKNRDKPRAGKKVSIDLVQFMMNITKPNKENNDKRYK
jgi:hypothetical protein